MSKGPGKWQRQILDALDGDDWVIICDLLPGDAKRSEQSALNRAAHTLRRVGKVDIVYRNRAVNSPRGWNQNRHVRPAVLVVTRPGFEAPVQYGGKWVPREG